MPSQMQNRVVAQKVQPPAHPNGVSVRWHSWSCSIQQQQNRIIILDVDIIETNCDRTAVSIKNAKSKKKPKIPWRRCYEEENETFKLSQAVIINNIHKSFIPRIRMRSQRSNTVEKYWIVLLLLLRLLLLLLLFLLISICCCSEVKVWASCFVALVVRCAQSERVSVPRGRRKWKEEAKLDLVIIIESWHICRGANCLRFLSLHFWTNFFGISPERIRCAGSIYFGSKMKNAPARE